MKHEITSQPIYFLKQWLVPEIWMILKRQLSYSRKAGVGVGGGRVNSGLVNRVMASEPHDLARV